MNSGHRFTPPARQRIRIGFWQSDVGATVTAPHEAIVRRSCRESGFHEIDYVQPWPPRPGEVRQCLSCGAWLTIGGRR